MEGEMENPNEAPEDPQDNPPPALPARIEQADHVELVQRVGAMREKRAALREAEARLELARRDSLAADAACVEVEKRLQAKYQTCDRDQYAADGTIWRAQG